MKKKYKFQNPGRTIKEMLALSTEKFPTNNAFKVKNRGKIESVSFLQLTNDVRNLGTELHSLELSDKRVGIIGENSYTIEGISSKPLQVDGSFSEYVKHVGNLSEGEWVYQVVLGGSEGEQGCVLKANIIIERISPKNFIVN